MPNMSSSLCFLAFLFLLPGSILAKPMLKTPEEQQEKSPQFWSFFLHPGRFETKPADELEGPENGQKSKGKEDSSNTSELGRIGEEPLDYYDAVRQEEESQRQRDDANISNDTEPSLLNLMTALRVNIAPLPTILVDGSAEAGKGMKPIVFPAKRREDTEGRRKKQQKTNNFTLDGDTYDDERAEMGRADEAEEEEKLDEKKAEERKGKDGKVRGEKVVEEEGEGGKELDGEEKQPEVQGKKAEVERKRNESTPVDIVILLPPSKESEADLDPVDVAASPIVDGNTGSEEGEAPEAMVDAETGEQGQNDMKNEMLAMPPRAAVFFA